MASDGLNNNNIRLLFQHQGIQRLWQQCDVTSCRSQTQQVGSQGITDTQIINTACVFSDVLELRLFTLHHVFTLQNQQCFSHTFHTHSALYLSSWEIVQRRSSLRTSVVCLIRVSSSNLQRSRRSTRAEHVKVQCLQASCVSETQRQYSLIFAGVWIIEKYL